MTNKESKFRGLNTPNMSKHSSCSPQKEENSKKERLIVRKDNTWNYCTQENETLNFVLLLTL